MMSLEDVGIERLVYREFVPSRTTGEPLFTGSVGAGESDIKNEPMLFSSDLCFSVTNGGILTRFFLSELRKLIGDEIGNAIIDSRVHMLKRGWYPCIPGWHVDDFYRPTDGQPDLEHIPHQSHYMMLLGDCSRTQFLDGPVRLHDPIPGEKLYDSYNRQINRLLARKDVGVKSVETGRIIRFGNGDLHRGVAATGDGWRFFIRATIGSTRKPENEIRRQVQVYLSALEAGW